MPSMADDFTTIEGIHTVLAATSTYDVDRDVAMAKRHLTALRRMKHFASSTSRDGQAMSMDLNAIEDEIARCLAFIRSQDSPTDAQKKASPNVTHADFSTFRGYQ